MPRLPRVTAHEIIGVLEKAGFSLARQSGSHMIYKNAAGKRVTRHIPCCEDSSSEATEKHPA